MFVFYPVHIWSMLLSRIGISIREILDAIILILSIFRLLKSASVCVCVCASTKHGICFSTTIHSTHIPVYVAAASSKCHFFCLPSTDPDIVFLFLVWRKFYSFQYFVSFFCWHFRYTLMNGQKVFAVIILFIFSSIVYQSIVEFQKKKEKNKFNFLSPR